MGQVELTAPRVDFDARPILVVFESERSGRCRRFAGLLATVLQRRRNHDTFKLARIDVDQHPELAARFRVDSVPALIVIEDKSVRVRVTGLTCDGSLEQALKPWLR